MAGTGTIAPLPRFSGFDANGDPVASGQLWTYIAGTSTPVATYTDVGLTVPHANPIVLNSAGRPASGGSECGIYLTPGSAYKFVLQTATGATVWTQDNVAAVPTASQTVDVTGPAGEALGAYTAVYLSDGSGGRAAGQWYLTDADTTTMSTLPSQVGMTTGPIAIGAQGTIRLVGALTVPTAAYTAGTTYYASATAGALTATAPANKRFLGVAQTITTILLGGQPPPSALGVPIDVPFNAADYTTSPAGTWTVPSGNVTAHRYSIINKTAFYFFHITGSTVSGGVTTLLIKNPVPGATGTASGLCVATANAEVDVAFVNAGSTNIALVRPTGTAWPTNTGDLRVTIGFLLP